MSVIGRFVSLRARFAGCYLCSQPRLAPRELTTVARDSRDSRPALPAHGRLAFRSAPRAPDLQRQDSMVSKRSDVLFWAFLDHHDVGIGGKPRSGTAGHVGSIAPDKARSLLSSGDNRRVA